MNWTIRHEKSMSEVCLVCNKELNEQEKEVKAEDSYFSQGCCFECRTNGKLLELLCK